MANKTTMRDIAAFLSQAEEELNVETNGESDPIIRMTNIVNQLLKRHKKTRRDLQKARREHDEMVVTWRLFGKYIGANAYDLEKIFGIERDHRPTKADRSEVSRRNGR